MLLTKEVEVRLWSRHIKHYLDLGYQGKHGDIIIVKVKDLPKKSGVKVEVQCDHCGNTKWIAYADYLSSIEKYGKYNCNKCMHRTNVEIFNKYGVSNYSSTLECREKVKNSFLEHYGVDNCAKSNEVLHKMKSTNLQKYNCANPMQYSEIKVKANETLCKNGTQKTSKQQLYLHSLYGGELNYPISYYATDICIPEEKLVIEYDGGGHDLRVTLGRLTQEEFDQKEIVRNSVIKRQGYKIITIKSKFDKLPSDDILLQILDYARNYFSTYPNHSWIEFNVDTSLIRSAEHKDGVYYNYGELRTIKDGNVSTIVF